MKRREDPEDQVPPFERDALREHAATGLPKDQVAILLEVDYDELPEAHRETFDQDYATGLATGTAQVFAGLRDGGAQGDTKAAQMFLDYVGCRPTPAAGKPSDTDGALTTRRLKVIVTTEDGTEVNPIDSNGDDE